MGAASSVIPYELKEIGRIYKNRSKCKCIFSCRYKNFIGDKLELLYCCYDCLQELKSKSYDTIRLKLLIDETKNIQIETAIRESNWLSEKDAMLYALKHRIDVKEFLTNSNILERYNIEV
jgi:hypothetical protein